jgi:hypothetical protein
MARKVRYMSGNDPMSYQVMRKRAIERTAGSERLSAMDDIKLEISRIISDRSPPVRMARQRYILRSDGHSSTLSRTLQSLSGPLDSRLISNAQFSRRYADEAGWFLGANTAAVAILIVVHITKERSQRVPIL